MGQLITLTAGNDRFFQSSLSANSSLVIKSFAGNDKIVLDRDDDLGGSNQVFAGLGNDSVVNHAEFNNVIVLGDGNDTYVGLGFGFSSSDLIDQVFGGAGNDTFAVKTFHSEYYGGKGADTFHSVGWQNTFVGGAGGDTISYLPRSDDSTVGDTAVTVDLAAGLTQTGTIRQERLVSIEHVIGSNNDDAIFGTEGANRLRGGQGFDQLTGRGGADSFVFVNINEAAAAVEGNELFVDIITDFSRAQGDKVNLHRIDANAVADGNQDFRFVATPFTGKAGEVRFQDGFIEGDVNGDAQADFLIALDGVTTMVASDFIL